MPQHAIGFLGRGTDDAESSGAFAVETHALGEGVGDKKIQALVSQQAYSEGIRLQAVRETLVGEVQERDQLAVAQNGGQVGPFGWGQIRAGWVMTADVQQHDALRGQRADGAPHGVESHAAVWVVVGVGLDRNIGTFKYRAVIVPGRIAEPDRACRKPAADEFGPDF